MPGASDLWLSMRRCKANTSASCQIKLSLVSTRAFIQSPQIGGGQELQTVLGGGLVGGGRLGYALGVESGTDQNVHPTFLFDFHAHHGPILHHLATVQQTTDVAIGIGRLTVP